MAKPQQFINPLIFFLGKELQFTDLQHINCLSVIGLTVKSLVVFMDYPPFWFSIATGYFELPC